MYNNDADATFEQALCINSTDQREAAVASNRKVCTPIFCYSVNNNTYMVFYGDGNDYCICLLTL